MSFVFIGDDNYEEFEQLNDVEIWKKRLLPMGGFDDNTPTEEYITSMSDDMLRARFRLDHARLVSVEMVMDNLTHELAWREVYER